MQENINYAEIMKIILKEDVYLELLKKIAKENTRKEISLDGFFEQIFNKYCFIILMIGMLKKVEIEKYKFKISNTEIIEVESKKITKEYEKYIKIVEERKFEVIKEII